MTSVLVSLEGKLGGEEKPNRQLLTLLYMVFHTISTAMRFEPANAKFFYHEVRWSYVMGLIILCINE